MKRFVYLVCFLIPTGLTAAVPMARVVNVIDSHTISVENGRQRTSIALAGVAIPPGEEAAAIDYLHRLVDGAWVYVEDGNVYRSPDGLFVNAEMQRHAWWSSSNMRYLGLSDPGPRAATKTDAKRPTPGKAASPSGSRRRAPARRSPTPHLP